MTRSEFVSFVLNYGVENATVISSPDYHGGERLITFINCKVVQNIWEIPAKLQKNYDECGYYVLQPHERVRYCGDATNIIKNRRRVLKEHHEVRYIGQWDNEFSLEELICCKVTGAPLYDYEP